jgi:ribosomal protein L7Ae-like RNA K-turn-binding protein
LGRRVRSRRAEALALLGMAQRAGAVVKGVDGTRRCLRTGRAHLVVLAEDGALVQRRKVIPLAESRGVPWRDLGLRGELGAALGASQLTAATVTRRRFSDELLERLEGG